MGRRHPSCEEVVTAARGLPPLQFDPQAGRARCTLLNVRRSAALHLSGGSSRRHRRRRAATAHRDCRPTRQEHSPEEEHAEGQLPEPASHAAQRPASLPTCRTHHGSRRPAAAVHLPLLVEVGGRALRPPAQRPHPRLQGDERDGGGVRPRLLTMQHGQRRRVAAHQRRRQRKRHMCRDPHPRDHSSG